MFIQTPRHRANQITHCARSLRVRGHSNFGRIYTCKRRLYGSALGLGYWQNYRGIEAFHSKFSGTAQCCSACPRNPLGRGIIILAQKGLRSVLFRQTADIASNPIVSPREKSAEAKEKKTYSIKSWGVTKALEANLLPSAEAEVN